MNKKIMSPAIVIVLSFISNISFSQDSLKRVLSPAYDPHYDKIIPDKVFEIGLPLLLIFLISNGVSNVLKARSEYRLKEKALDKQISEPTLIALFAEDKALSKYSYLKWFLILAALGISFIIIQVLANAFEIKSGYLAVGIISLLMSFAFLLYYNILKNK